MARSALMNVMVTAATKAGRRLIRDFGEIENLQVSVKGPGDFVTLADKRAEQQLQYELEKARPKWGFLLEESGVVEGEDQNYRWIIDPLDGTTNFMHGIPQFAISIALEHQGELVAGLVYAPVLDELFTAEKGRGAFLNDRRIRVSGRKKLIDCVCATGIPHHGRGDHGAYLHQLAVVMREVHGVRRFGAAALDLAYVAAGRFDVFFESHLQPWDMAAGLVLLREAGGLACDQNGGADMLDNGSIIAGNEKLRDQLLGVLKKV